MGRQGRNVSSEVQDPPDKALRPLKLKTLKQLQGAVAYLQGRKDNLSDADAGAPFGIDGSTVGEGRERLLELFSLDSSIPKGSLAAPLAQWLATAEQALSLWSQLATPAAAERPMVRCAAMLSIITSFIVPRVLPSATGALGFLVDSPVDLEFVPSEAAANSLPELLAGDVDLLLDDIPQVDWDAKSDSIRNSIHRRRLCDSAAPGIFWNKRNERITQAVVGILQESKEKDRLQAWEALGEHDLYLFSRPVRPFLEQVLPRLKLRRGHGRTAQRIGLYSNNQLVESVKADLGFATGHVDGEPWVESGGLAHSTILYRAENDPHTSVQTEILSLRFVDIPIESGHWKALKTSIGGVNAPSIQVYARARDLTAELPDGDWARNKQRAILQLRELIRQKGEGYVHQYRS